MCILIDLENKNLNQEIDKLRDFENEKYLIPYHLGNRLDRILWFTHVLKQFTPCKNKMNWDYVFETHWMSVSSLNKIVGLSKYNSYSWK